MIRIITMRAITILLLLIIIPSVSAVGISQKPVEVMDPGQEIEHRINIQNDVNRTAVIQVSTNHPWLSFDGEKEVEITVPALKTDNYIYATVKVPKDTERGTNTTISYLVSANDNTQGQVPMGVAISSKFIVSVPTEPVAQETDSGLSPLIIGGLVVIILALLAVMLVFSTRVTRLINKKPILIGGKKARSWHEAALFLSQSEPKWPDVREKVARWAATNSKDAHFIQEIRHAKNKDELVRILLSK